MWLRIHSPDTTYKEGAHYLPASSSLFATSLPGQLGSQYMDLFPFPKISKPRKSQGQNLQFLLPEMLLKASVFSESQV